MTPMNNSIKAFESDSFSLEVVVIEISETQKGGGRKGKNC